MSAEKKQNQAGKNSKHQHPSSVKSTTARQGEAPSTNVLTWLRRKKSGKETNGKWQMADGRWQMTNLGEELLQKCRILRNNAFCPYPRPGADLELQKPQK